MCIILIGKITKKMHKNALETNKDGFSVFNERWGLVKAPKEAIVKASIGEFGVWHYRIGTSGVKGKESIHPFRVCKGKYLLYHNGVLGSGVGDLSDTAALADLMYDMTLKTVRSVLSSLQTGQRFALVNASDPKEFELFGDWVCEAGVLMSHKLYAPYKQYGKDLKALKVNEVSYCTYDKEFEKKEGGIVYETVENVFRR